MTLAPDLDTLAPIPDWGLTRDAAIDWANERGIPIPIKKKSSPYSIDENLWGRSNECGVLEDPWVAPPDDAFQFVIDPKDAPDEAKHVIVSFEKGKPVALDGQATLAEPRVDAVCCGLQRVPRRVGVEPEVLA